VRNASNNLRNAKLLTTQAIVKYRERSQSTRRLSSTSNESRFKALRRRINVAGEWGADVPGKYERPRRGAVFEHSAAAGARLLGIGVLRKIPVWVINLQQVVEDIASESRMPIAALQLENHMTR
jgi:hypothetical protein